MSDQLLDDAKAIAPLVRNGLAPQVDIDDSTLSWIVVETIAQYQRIAAERDQRKPPVQHHRVGPGRCVCGFDAYQIDGIMLDYGGLLFAHIRAAQATE